MASGSQGQELFQGRVAERRVDIVGIVEQLLVLATRFGEIHCSPAAPDKLRFEIRGHPPLEVPLEAAKSRLRTMCARLAFLRQKSGEEFEPYGGEGFIEKAPEGETSNGTRRKWHVRYHNTTDKQDFTITAQEEAPTRAR
jgi:hypothetical protein